MGRPREFGLGSNSCHRVTRAQDSVKRSRIQRTCSWGLESSSWRRADAVGAMSTLPQLAPSDAFLVVVARDRQKRSVMSTAAT